MKRGCLIFAIIGALLGVSVLGYSIYYLWQKNQEKPVVFKTESPSMQTIIKKTVATGSVVPRKEVDIKPRVSGLIAELYVEPSDFVKKGDKVAKINIIPDVVSLNNAENRLSRAKIALENTHREYKRNKQLFEEGVISEAAFRPFEFDYENSQQELKAAEDNLELIKEGTTKRSASYGNTIVRSTLTGTVLDVPVEEGNSVIEANTFNDGTSVAIIANMSEMVFEGKVDESEVGKLREGMDLLLTIGALEGESFEAKLEYIAPRGVEENGAIQFEIRAAVLLKENVTIRSNYSANADIVLAKQENVLAIPESLLQFEGDSVYVEIEVGEQEFEKRYIQTGLSDGLNIEIISGLQKEDAIKGRAIEE